MFVNDQKTKDVFKKFTRYLEIYTRIYLQIFYVNF